MNLKFSDSDVIMRAKYAYSHFSLVAARLQKIETYEVDSCIRGHHVFQVLAVAPLCVLSRARARCHACIWPALVSNYWQLFNLAIDFRIAKPKRSPKLPGIQYTHSVVQFYCLSESL